MVARLPDDERSHITLGWALGELKEMRDPDYRETLREQFRHVDGVAMERAVVLIGVRKSGDLTELQAVSRALATMQDWADGQGIPADSIKTLSDADGTAVQAGDILAAVRGYVELHTVEQLIVYFSGHGVNNNGSEYWLLSGAPENANEAVNVARSIRLAERCGIPHVVLISDACRKPPTGIQADDVTGQVIFPNRPVGGPPGCVDIFYACGLGQASNEIEDVPRSSGTYRAVYTEVLAEALDGAYADLRERVLEGGAAFDVVRPYPLKEALPGLVSARIRVSGAPASTSQWPAGLVCSGAKAWLSRITGASPPPPPSPPSIARPPMGGSGGGGSGDWVVRVPKHPQRRDSSERRRAARFPDVSFRWRPASKGLREFDTADPARRAAAAAAERLAQPADFIGVGGAAALCVRGSKFKGFKGAYATRKGGYSLVKLPRQVRPDVLQVGLDEDRPVAVVVGLFPGRCAVVPAFPGHLGILTMEEGQLVDVSYAPLSRPLRPGYAAYRAQIAAASRFGIAWWEGYSAADLVEQYEWMGADDPSLAVYLAYALTDMGCRYHVSKLLNASGPELFDVRLLSEERSELAVAPFPLLARGWALLDPPGPEQGLPTPQISHWTLFTDTDLPPLRALLGKEGAM
ncbi:hypothetical protein ACWCP6_27580 [Streptomyces sp. NPDC002004]